MDNEFNNEELAQDEEQKKLDETKDEVKSESQEPETKEDVESKESEQKDETESQEPETKEDVESKEPEQKDESESQEPETKDDEVKSELQESEIKDEVDYKEFFIESQFNSLDINAEKANDEFLKNESRQISEALTQFCRINNIDEKKPMDELEPAQIQLVQQWIQVAQKTASERQSEFNKTIALQKTAFILDKLGVSEDVVKEHAQTILEHINAMTGKRTTAELRFVIDSVLSKTKSNIEQQKQIEVQLPPVEVLEIKPEQQQNKAEDLKAELKDESKRVPSKTSVLQFTEEQIKNMSVDEFLKNEKAIKLQMMQMG